MEAEKIKIACLGSKYVSWLTCAVSERGPIVVFIADLNRSRSAEKEYHLSHLNQTKIDRSKKHESSTSFA